MLQENNLTLATAITKCRSTEAARKNRLDIATQESEVVAALCRPPQPTHHTPHVTCPGCGLATHRGGRRYCLAYDQICSYCHKVGHFACVCRSKATKNNNPQPQHQPSTNAIRVQSQQSNQHQYMQLYKVQDGKTEPAPTITVRVIIINWGTLPRCTSGFWGRHICCRSGCLDAPWAACRQYPPIFYQPENCKWPEHDAVG